MKLLGCSLNGKKYLGICGEASYMGQMSIPSLSMEHMDGHILKMNDGDDDDDD